MNEIIMNHKDAEKYVYHYTKASTALTIIKTHKLKIGSFTSTNDPKETKQWKFDFGTNEKRDLGKYNGNELSAELSTKLKETTKVICFSKDKVPLSGEYIKDIVSRGFCKPRMWAQYADNHKGVCLIFDKNVLDREVTKTFGKKYTVLKGEVEYIDRGIVLPFGEGPYTINVDYLEKHGFQNYASAHFQTFHRRLFFEKMKDWSNENEYRWIFATETKQDLYFHYGQSLLGIVFGENTETSDIDGLIELTNYQIKYMGLKWKNCSPWYDFGNFKYDKALRNSPWYKK